ncbi:MAG TPA: hypothetical protein VG672_21850, partial [Bryobacteraceae bacterium]|nr:hypothetical protein [Bryobacteraceae bacterium]
MALCAAGLGLAQPEKTSAPPAPAKEERKPPVPEERTVETKHTIRIQGMDLNYTATAGTVVLKREDGTARASIFYVAYTRDGIADLSRRPLTFAFNGGPGSSSVWLHMGTLGPKRVLMDPEGHMLP